MSQELQLLAEALSTQGEAEQDGVKYIYMDDSTIYRFENNRMKKVSAALIKKATKLLTQQGNVPNDLDKPSKTAKKGKQGKRSREADEDMSENEDRRRSGERRERSDWSDTDEQEPVRKPVPKRSGVRKREALAEGKPAPEVDIQEYYNNRAKLEYQSLEISRLTNKVNKLKQYKSIVNKITGGEFDVPIPQQAQEYEVLSSAKPVQEPVQEPQTGARRGSGSLFDWY